MSVVGTGIGSLPGTDFAEAVKVVLDELSGEHGVPHLPELPARGVGADMIGRALAVVEGLDADLQPAGWRLTGSAGSPGVDQRRARSLLAQDLDVLEELSAGYTGPFKIQLAGPWTLAATVERPRGDRLIADHGARRELAQSLAEGTRTHLRDVRRRLPGVQRLIVQVDEPALDAVINARIPTASGYGRHRSIDLPEASQSLQWVLEAVADEGGEPWVHSCAASTPWDLVRGAGAKGLAADMAQLTARDLDVLAGALEAGESVVLGAVPSLEPAGGLSDKQVTEQVLRWLDMVGLDPHEVAVAISPSCGLAGASVEWSRRAIALVRTSAASLSG